MSKLKINNTTATANPIIKLTEKERELIVFGIPTVSRSCFYQIYLLTQTYPNQSFSYDIHTHLEEFGFKTHSIIS
jgi:hypothetical protein